MIIFAADLHLTPLTWAGMPALRGDAYCALRQLTDHCIELVTEGGYDTVELILGGDVFDKKRPDSESVAAFVAAAAELTKHRVGVWVIQGNHDAADPPWAELSPGVCYIGDGEVVEIDGHQVCGYDNMSAAALEAQLAEDVTEGKQYEILVLHQMCKQLISFSEAGDFDAEWTPPGVELVLMGDLHQQVHLLKTEKNPAVSYSGATHMRKLGEPPHSGFLTITWDADGARHIANTGLKVRDVIEVVIVDDESMAAAAKAITEYPHDDSKPEEIRTPLVVARFNDAVDHVRERLRKLCEPIDGSDGEEDVTRPGCLLLERPLTTGVDGEQLEPLADGQSGVTLEGCLSQVVDAEQDAELHSLVLALLRPAAEATDVLAETRHRMGVEL